MTVAKSIDANRAKFLMGNKQENYALQLRSQDYSKFSVKRITSKIDHFKIHRRVETNYQTGTGDHKAVGWIEDKVTYTDPELWFYRENFGRGLPGAFTSTSEGARHCVLLSSYNCLSCLETKGTSKLNCNKKIHPHD